MNVSDSSRYRCPGASKARVSTQADDTRSASPTGRAILLLLVGTAHLAGLWALSDRKGHRHCIAGAAHGDHDRACAGKRAA